MEWVLRIRRGIKSISYVGTLVTYIVWIGTILVEIVLIRLFLELILVFVTEFAL